jgi:UDP-N-acetylglucosamine 3-dehydrogenase
MDKLRFGVIGLGWFGEKHCEALAALPNVEIHSLCTRTEKRLKEVAKTFKVKKTFTDYNEMLADPDLDAVSIVTMWDQHCAPTLAALAAGKHVFCEKPMASTMADCRKMVAAAAKAKGNFMVGHICRFNPRYALAKRAIDDGQIGKIVSMSARRNLPRWIVTAILPKIGPIIGDGVHDTDLMLWFTGAKIVSAYAQTVDVRGLGNPDLGQTMYRFDSGATAMLEDIWYLPENSAMQIDERMEIVGTEGSIQINDTTPNFCLCDKDGFKYPDTTYWSTYYGKLWGALPNELQYFADCCLKGEKPTVVPPEESMAAVEACLAAEKSAATGKIVKL